MNTDRRSFILAGSAAIAGSLLPRSLRGDVVVSRARALPSAAQLAWQRDELAMFLHFGVNTFTNREWGDGTEDPSIFNPTKLDAGQWARAAKSGGFKSVILTAKHHDGFCLWPTKTTTHSVASSPFRDGKGDVVREFVDAARAEGLKVGLYLSPWDRNHPAYGDSPKYNDVYVAQLTELLTGYGALAEVWFDGANGEGPNGKKQVYDWPRVWGTVKKLQPGAVIFSDAGPDVRWCGNERGVAGDPNWSTVDPSIVTVPGVSGPAVDASLLHGDPAGTVWRPAEADVSIRTGWFHHPAEDDRVRSVDYLKELYYSSVGRNSKLLLNVPPTASGLIHETDVARLGAFRTRLNQLFKDDKAALFLISWTAKSERVLVGEVELPELTSAGLMRLEEKIEEGQRIAKYTVECATGSTWQVLSTGSTIGNARIEKIPKVMMRRLRITLEGASELPLAVELKLFDGE